MLHGREPEQRRLAHLVDEARQGRAGVLVVRGEPGIGKSALLEDAVARAVDLQMLRTQGVESESPLAYAALHRLLGPLMGRVGHLPGPQSRALRIAFGQEEGDRVAPFLVGVATLSMLTDAAETQTLLCLVDDAHWLDAASADALLFAGRRLQADRIVLLFAAREGDVRTFVADGVPSLTLEGLDPMAARALLDRRGGDRVGSEVGGRLVTETGGNPLALLELSMGLTAAQLRGTAPLPAQLPLTAGVERAFLDRCRRLSPQVQTLLLVAAADDTGHLATVTHAAARLGVESWALQHAEQAGLLVADGDAVRVRHPLVRSAVYQAAVGLERRQAHLALAAVLGEGHDPDRQAWHRAAGAVGPDEDLATALEQVGARAERRGGYVAAAAAFERASELSVREDRRATLVYAAGRNAWACGQSTRAAALAAAARDQADDPLLRADIERLRGRIEVNVGSATTAHRIFTQAARTVGGLDPDRALEMAVAAAVMLNYGADSGAALDTSSLRVDTSPDETARTRCLKRLLASMMLAAEQDWAPALVALDEALRAGAPLADLDVLGNLGNAALHLGNDVAHRRSFTVMLSTAREDGAGMSVVYALQRLGFSQLVAGDWAGLRSSAEEALALSRSVGQRALTATPLAWLALLAALQDRPEYDDLVAQVGHVVATCDLGILTDPVHDLTRWAEGARAGQAGDPSAALHHLSRLRLPALIRMAAVDRMDAAVRAGAPGQARAWAEELAPFATGTDWPWALAAVDHGRALTAEADRARALYERALAHHERGGRPYDHARTHLAYGEHLRRAQHRVDARVHLRLALETFEDLQAQPLVTRTVEELRASGQTARRRDPSTLLTLTPMELKVAQLVSTGLSNKEAAAQCWVSPRTVAYHLRNVFAKTGVTSRGALSQLELR